MSGALLEFGDAAVGYGAATIVSGVLLSVAPGEIVGLVGPNGAGKSTLIRTVLGEADLLGGTVSLGGRPLSELGARDRARFAGVVPQQVIAEFSFPARDFVAMGRHAHLPRFRPPGDIDAEVVERAMRLTDTTHLADKPIDALSGGDLQRLAFAQALAQQPKLLLLDEPTSHLDLNHRLQVLDLVRELADEGMGVLAVFHDLDMAARYADRIAIVADGTVAPAVEPEQAITAESVRSTFGVRAVVGVDPVTGAVAVTPVLRDGAVAAEERGAVVVVGGSGVAAPLLRRLVIAGWRVSAAALNGGDADAALADALGVDYPAIAPFAPMDSTSEALVAERAAAATAVVVCAVPFGHGNLGNLRAAVNSGAPMVLVGGIDGRDYTGGEATELWNRALEAGALVVDSADSVEAALGSIVRDDL